MALEAILRAVPQEMLLTLAVKETAKEAWDSIRVMRVGVDRVRKSKAQLFLRQYDAIEFKEGESVEDFSLRLNNLVTTLVTLGAPIEESKVVQKFLNAVPEHLQQIALSIETLLDVEELSLEEVTGHWAKDCRQPRKNTEAHQAHAKEDDVEPALLMAHVCAISGASPMPRPLAPAPPLQTIMLDELKVFAYLHQEENMDACVWHLDTDATNHMTGVRSAFVELDLAHRALTEVYFIPKLNANLISLGQLDEHGCDVRIYHGVCTIRDPAKKLLAKVRCNANRLYLLKLMTGHPVCLSACTSDTAWLWHARFGHLHFDALRKLADKDMVRGLPRIEHVEQLCDGCIISKHRRSPFPTRAVYRATDRLDLVHGDLCGPISPATPGGKSYFLLLVDDHSRYMWLVLLARKGDAVKAIMHFQASAEAESDRKLHHGVGRHFSAPYSPQQNGVVERRNQTILATACSLLKAKGMPARFWGEAVTMAVFLLNRAPTKSLENRTPYEAWFGKKPAVGHLRTFGCLAYVKNMRPHLSKLEDRSTPMVFIGYAAGTKGYKVFDPVTGRVQVSRDVIFDEGASWDWGAEAAESGLEQTEFSIEYVLTQVSGGGRGAQEENSSPSSRRAASTTPEEPRTPSPSLGPRASLHGTSPVFISPPSRGDEHLDADHDDCPPRYRPLGDLLGDAAAPGLAERALAPEQLYLQEAEEPASFNEAEQHQRWRSTMLEEIATIEENKTWRLVDLPRGHHAIGLKWVFKVKKDARGEVTKFKARLVAKGYVQQPGVDFNEVFAPMARLESVRMLLALAAQAGWFVHHMDVKSAFLNGELTEEVYVVQPPGFVVEGHEHQVLKLDKALYGLRQAPRVWNAKLDTSLTSLGFRRCDFEHAVYAQGQGTHHLLVGVYVDDLIITGSDAVEIDRFKAEMMSLFRMSDLGLLCFYLGIEVKQVAGSTRLTQSAFARRILEKAGMQDCNACVTPMEQRLKLSKHSDAPLVDSTGYRSIVGSLRYLVHTRLDIAFAVGYVSRFMEAPTAEHEAAVKRILRYIAGTIDYGIIYRRSETPATLVGFSDADMAGDVDTRKRTSGVMFFLGSSPMAQLLGEINQAQPDVFKLMVDNKSAIALSKNPVFHDRRKHIATRYHYIRECVEEGRVQLEFTGTAYQVTDILTKSLGRVRFEELRSRIGVLEVSREHKV
uniref:Gag-pol polyprotein n=1 Tax=Oryza sativa subsp. japonica TaxID=39947 RepID=Q7Y1I1_ORYSJ|nr:putative gag-pol polyprotein [Oryza sativa Japonica Group]